MNDLTLIYISAGTLPEKWKEYHEAQLAKLPYPIIRKHDPEKISYQRIYDCLLEGAKEATTPYIAVIEDDTLYPPEHFHFRPPLDSFSYNQHRWALMTWQPEMYSWRNRKSNCTLIAPRELTIEALEERNKKWPNGWNHVGELGRERVDRWNDVTPRKCVEWYSKVGVIQINHDHGTEDRQQRHRKEHGPVRAIEIPVWGRSEDLIKKFT